MSSAAGRITALLLIAGAVLFVFYQSALPRKGDYGVQQYVVPRSNPGVILVTSVRNGSSAARAGIRKGDTIAFGRTAVERANVTYATNGTRVAVTVNGTRTAVLTARTQPARWDASLVFSTLIRLAFLCVAALLVWRRFEDAAARWLAFFLTCYGVAIGLANGVLPAPLLSLIVLQIGGGALFLIGTAAAAGFAANFPVASDSPIVRRMAWLAELIAVATALVLVGGEWLPRTGGIISIVNAALIAAFVAIGALVVATLIVTYAQGAPAHRQRRRWVFFIVGFGLSGLIADIVFQSVFGFNKWADLIVLIPVAVLPFGLAYTILRHRVIDVGFVINRAVVFTGVSLFVVGIFVIVETLVAKYVERASHVESTAVQLAVALALGFSIRFIHARVDRFVDTVFFRERHEAETALHEFAHDAAYITDPFTLLDRCIGVVTRYGGAGGAGVWLRDDDGIYRMRAGTLPAQLTGENDTTLVAMRARRVVVDLPQHGSVLPGTIALPMIVRGRLDGALVCGPKTDGDDYAPDERAALAAVASAVGQALDGLRVAELERTVERLQRAADATQGAMGTF